VLDMIGYGWTAEQIHEGHDRYLSLAQIHAALSYYYDHKAEYDAEIERQNREYEELRAQNLNSPIRQKLRALGKIPSTSPITWMRISPAQSPKVCGSGAFWC